MYKCVLCKSELFNNYDEMICDNCKVNIASYLRLELIDRGNYKIYVLFFYEGDIKKLIRCFKFHEGTYLAKVFSIYLSRAIREEGIPCETISYIPMHSKKKAIRGFDQAELLARQSAIIMNVNFSKILIRKKRTKSLYNLDKEARKIELRDAFILVNKTDNLLIIEINR